MKLGAVEVEGVELGEVKVGPAPTQREGVKM